MVDSNKYADDAHRWRDKYFTLSEELEKNETDYASYLKVLQRALVRISLAADGQDNELDKQLASLRNMLRKEPVDQAKINANLVQVETTILRLEKKRKQDEPQGLHTLQQLVEQLAQLNLPRDKQRALKRFAKSLQAQGSQLSAYPGLLEQYSHLQREALAESMQATVGSQVAGCQPQSNSQSQTQSQSQPQTSSKGLLSRLFGAKTAALTPAQLDTGSGANPAISALEQTAAVGEGPSAGREPSANQEPSAGKKPSANQEPSASKEPSGSKEPSASEKPESVAANRTNTEADPASITTNQQSAAEPESRSDDGAGSASGPVPESAQQHAQVEDLDAVVCVLVDLLEQLPLSPDVRGEAEQLRDQLAKLAEAGELGRVVDGTAELVLEALGKSQRDFEQFLLTMDEQLTQINDYFAAQAETEASRKETSQQLNQLNVMVRSQVGNISQAVGAATDVHSLKNSVQNQLNNIVSSMDQFVESESQREQALEQQLQAMREQLEIMQSEAQVIRKRLHNETLRALTDTLTRLPNREAFDERFTLERERFLRYKHPASLAILDIDHFKQVNDKHGHLVGDRVLQEVARKIQQTIRKTDFLARYGGEEFVLIMPETPLEPAGLALQKIRRALAETPLNALSSSDTVTLSAGLATFQLGEKAEQLIARADKALYQAKAQGRNRVEIAES